MQIVTIAGNLGRDAEFKTTQQGDAFCKFSVAVSTGWGDRKATTWWDVTRWGKGAEGLAKILTKGAKVSVSGEMSTREHEGKTYLQVRADHVTMQGGGASDSDRVHDDAAYGADLRSPQQAHNETRRVGATQADPFEDDLDDSVPF